jgi:hypothetical protein
MKHNDEISNFLLIAKGRALDQAQEEFIDQMRLTLLTEGNQPTVIASTFMAQYRGKIDRIHKNYVAIKDMIG